MTDAPKAVVLSSGGIDSTTALAIARRDGFRLYSLSFDYGQRHACELTAARRVADAFTVEKHMVFRMDLTQIGGSALTADITVPKTGKLPDPADGIPATYVPARNTIFLSIALAWAEVLGAFDIYIGVNALDYSGYPDCRPEYIEAFQRMANLATRSGVEGAAPIRIRTPLIHLPKAEIIRLGIELGIDYSITHSCYDPSPDGLACGLCESCVLRKKGFAGAGVADPTLYGAAR
jgi:7-cyano-7-deazaguanine synthase